MNTGLLQGNKSVGLTDKSFTSRNYGIDLLRIVSMLMICVVHVINKGGLINYTINPSGYMTKYGLLSACLPCVNCYALISGYVGITAKHRYSNLIKLWMTVFFYSFGFTLIFYFLYPGTVGIKALIKSAFPVVFGMYWYFTAYFFLFFFLPIINKGLAALSKREHRNLVLALFFFASFVSTLMSMHNSEIVLLSNGYSVWWLFILYIIGAYLRRCGGMIFASHPTGKWAALFFASVSFTWSLRFIFSSLGHEALSKIFSSYTSPTVVLSAVSLVMIFSGFRIEGTAAKIIKFLAPLCFSVYLIHVQDSVWENIIKDRFASLATCPAAAIPLIAIGVAVGIYILCTIIDIGRFYLFKLLRINSLSEWLESSITRICKSLIKKFLPSLSYDDENDG